MAPTITEIESSKMFFVVMICSSWFFMVIVSVALTIIETKIREMLT